MLTERHGFGSVDNEDYFLTLKLGAYVQFVPMLKNIDLLDLAHYKI